MRRYALVVVVLLAGAAAAHAQEDIKSVFPRPQEVAGWSTSLDIKEISAEGVPEWKGSDAQLLLDYNIRSAAGARYTGPNDALIDVEVYRMDNPADAFGLFSCLRPAENVRMLEVNQGAFISGETGCLWKNTFCVKVSGLEGAGATALSIEGFLRAISGRIDTTAALPDLFRVVETVGYVAGSTRYLHTNNALNILHPVSEENVLRLDDRSNMVIAKFLIDERLFDAFVVRYPSEEEAVSAAASYAKFLGSNGDAEATWFQQFGRVIVGTWTGLEVSETQDSEYMLFDTIKELIRQVRIFQMNK